MTTLGWTRNCFGISPQARWNALLIPMLYVVNCFTFSAVSELGQVATKPWLLLVWLYGLVILVPLAWRDRAPVIVFAAQCVFTLAAWPIMPRYVPVVGIPAALYAVAAHRGRKISVPALLVSFIPNVLAATVALRNPGFTFSEAMTAFIQNSIFIGIITAAAWGGGRLTQARRRHVQTLERERDEANEAVTEQRRRLARELHDIISHAVTVMVVQAGGAARIAETDFSQITETDFRQVTRSLVHIETYGRRAMAELRRLLGVLGGAGRGELKPQPGMADLDELLASLRAVGMLVTVHTEGAPRELDDSVDLTVYRIVQEALTNVLKHAGADSNPRVRIAWQTQQLHLQVDNDTNPTGTHCGRELSSGSGLRGLHERVRAIGGDLHAGPQPDGYRLTATLPLADIAQP